MAHSSRDTEFQTGASLDLWAIRRCYGTLLATLLATLTLLLATLTLLLATLLATLARLLATLLATLAILLAKLLVTLATFSCYTCSL